MPRPGASGLDQEPPALRAPQVRPNPGPSGRCRFMAGLAFPALLRERCELSDNVERRGFCADEIIDSY